MTSEPAPDDPVPGHVIDRQYHDYYSTRTRNKTKQNKKNTLKYFIYWDRNDYDDEYVAN